MARGDRCERGGRLGLCELIEEHAEEIEADLLSRYGIDIYAYHRGEISTRRMLNLIRRLPPDSELGKAINGPSADWSREEHLLALLADRVSELTWVFICANSEEGEAPERPKPIPRPGIESEELADASSPAELASFFAS